MILPNDLFFDDYSPLVFGWVDVAMSFGSMYTNVEIGQQAGALYCEYCGKELVCVPDFRYNKKTGARYVKSISVQCPNYNDDVVSGMFGTYSPHTEDEQSVEDGEIPEWMYPYLETQ